MSSPPLPSLDEIKDADEEFWRWVFRQSDGANSHPLKISNRGKAQTQSGRILILAGALSGEPKPMRRDRRLEIPKGIDFVFVPADNCVYTKADKDGVNEQALVDSANLDFGLSLTSKSALKEQANQKMVRGGQTTIHQETQLLHLHVTTLLYMPRL